MRKTASRHRAATGLSRRMLVGVAAGTAALIAVPVAFSLPATQASYADGEYAGGVAVGVPHFSKPVITAVAGANTAPFSGQLAAGSATTSYLASLVTASDDHDGNLTSEVAVTAGGFNPTAPGTYDVAYNVDNSYGVAADAVTIPVSVWNFTKIDTGEYHTLALTSDGRVYGWGYNPYGEVMRPAGDVKTPTLLPQLAPYDVVDIAAAYNTSYAVTSDGSVYVWGYGANGQYGDGDTSTDAQLHKVAFPAGVKITSVDSDYYSAVALAGNGDVYTWGMGDYGALGTGNSNASSTPMKIMSNAVQVDQGWWGGAAVASGGSLYVWGTNLEGELGNLLSGGTNYTPTMVATSLLGGVKEVSYGGRHVMALTTGGQVYAWGLNSNNQVAPPLPLLGTTSPVTTPTLVSGVSGVTQINAGYDFSMAVTSGGSLYAWGNQDYGEFLTGNTTDYTSPQKSAVASNVGMVSAELDSGAYLTTDGTMVYSAGYNADYELGNNSTATTAAPQPWSFTPPPLG